MSERTRRHLPVPEKVAAIKRHLLAGIPVSQICDELSIKPTVFYSWQKLLFENAHLALENGRQSKADEDAKEKKIQQLEAKLQRKNEVLAELMEEHTKLKKTWGTLKGCWVPHEIRDELVDFIRAWGDKTDIPACRFLDWIELGTSKFHDWKKRYGKVNEHNAWVPRDHWLTEEEKRTIIAFAYDHPLDGYRPLTYMMLDQDVVAASPTSVWRVLHQAGLLARVSGKPSRKGTGFEQPLQPHEHWHVDVSYLNIAGTFYFLCSILDGYSRFLIHWEIRDKMEEGDVETIIQRARELYPGERPRIISDNGPPFIAKDFKEFIRICGMTHVKTSPYYPQSNGKIERFHRTIKGDCIRTQVPLSLEEARRLVSGYVSYYNEIRLHSAIGYVTPKDMLEGRAPEIFAARDRKLAEARERRKLLRQTAHREGATAGPPPSIDFAAVRALIPLAEVLALLQYVPTRTRGDQQRGPCPVHGSTQSGRSQCFSANTAENLCHCFKCGFGGNALDLWVAVTGQNIYDAAVDLCQRLGRPLPTKESARQPA